MPSHQVNPHVAELANPTRSGDPDMPTSPPKSPQSPKPQQSPRSRMLPWPGRAARGPGRALTRPAWRALLLAGAVAAMLGLPAVAQAALAHARADIAMLPAGAVNA